jgi:hypothetical protein
MNLDLALRTEIQKALAALFNQPVDPATTSTYQP